MLAAVIDKPCLRDRVFHERVLSRIELWPVDVLAAARLIELLASTTRSALAAFAVTDRPSGRRVATTLPSKRRIQEGVRLTRTGVSDRRADVECTRARRTYPGCSCRADGHDEERNLATRIRRQAHAIAGDAETLCRSGGMRIAGQTGATQSAVKSSVRATRRVTRPSNPSSGTDATAGRAGSRPIADPAAPTAPTSAANPPACRPSP